MRNLLSFLVLIIFINTIINYDLLLTISQNTLVLFFETLFPTLFLTSFLLYYLYELNFFFLLPTKKIAELFNMNQDGFNFTITLILLGYPFASYLIDQAYQKKQLSKEATLRLFYCIHISKISFIITYVGNILFTDFKISLIFYLIQLTSIIILLLLSKKQHINYLYQNHNSSLLNSLNQALITSFKQVLMISGYLMLILSITTIIKLIIPNLFILDYLLELTYAINCLAKANLNINTTFILAQFLVCFACFSIHLQIFSLIESIKVNYVTFIKYRLYQILIITVITLVIITIK